MSLKLLFDQNISRRVVGLLPPAFAGSRHVTQLRLGSNADRAIWDHARASGFSVVSKDADFHQMSFLFGAPPKIVWLRLGNCTTDDVVRCLVRREASIVAFLRDPESALLVVDS